MNPRGFAGRGTKNAVFVTLRWFAFENENSALESEMIRFTQTLFASTVVAAFTTSAFGQFPVNVADSAAEFPAADNASSDSKQGINGWTYGYHNFTVNGAYTGGNFIAFPDNAGPGTGPGDFWNGTSWDWHAGNPPWTQIGQTAAHPNGTNNVHEHWPIRRWTSDVSGAANISYQLNATNPGGPTGTDLTVFVNGVQQGATLEVATNDLVGTTFTTHLSNLNVGDTVDFALGPVGDDGGDGSAFSGVVTQVAARPTVLVADSIADFPGADNASSNSKQGINNWNYGYHSVTNNGTYDATPGGPDDFIAFPDNEGPGTSATDFWNGSAWDWHDGNPPWTTINATGGHPNGTNQTDEQWAIRRWIADVGGDLELEAYLETFSGNSNGTILHVFHNGVEIDSLTVDGADAAMDVFSIQNVGVGDFIDIALDSRGSDGSDSSAFSARIFQIVPEPASVAVWAMLGLGLFGWPLWRRIRHR